MPLVTLPPPPPTQPKVEAANKYEEEGRKEDKEEGRRLTKRKDDIRRTGCSSPVHLPFQGFVSAEAGFECS